MLQTLMDANADKALSMIAAFAKTLGEKAAVALGDAFAHYLECAGERYNTIRTPATGPIPQKIWGESSIYEAMRVRYRWKTIETYTAEYMMDCLTKANGAEKECRHIIIQGVGGSGKTMLMRHFFVTAANNGGYVPILLNLRQIRGKEIGKNVILDMVREELESFDIELSKEAFRYSLKAGKYLFLFDGLDEVPESQSKDMVEGIQNFSAKYPANPCIVTSRPGTDVSFETFIVADMLGFDLPQSVSLAEKLAAISEKPDKATEFCRRLEENLYRQYEEYAKNPLLLSIMFLTYVEYGSTPDSLADFYLNAFEALYKANYTARKFQDKGVNPRIFTCAQMGKRNFRIVFAHFCFRTYFDEIYEFYEHELMEYLRESIQKFGLDSLEGVNAENYLEDLQYIIGLILPDGDKYRFLHRSFQEHFAVYYACRVLTSDRRRQLFERMLSQECHWIRYSPYDNRYSYDFPYFSYFKLLYRIYPDIFMTSVMGNELRFLMIQAAHSQSPDIFLLKALFSGAMIGERVVAAANAHYSHGCPESIEILVFMQNNDFYTQNLLCLFCECVCGKELNYQVDMGENLSRYYQNHHPLLFEELDADTKITEEERRKLYAIMLQDFPFQELRETFLRLYPNPEESREKPKRMDDFFKDF